MTPFKKKSRLNAPLKQWKITRKCLELIYACARDSHPNEFAGLLRIDELQKDTIIELVLLPGTISGDAHAIFQMHMLPIDYTIAGTVHSHPSPYPVPSDADLELFRKRGKIHIISAHPYNSHSWRAYRYTGEETDLIVV